MEGGLLKYSFQSIEGGLLKMRGGSIVNEFYIILKYIMENTKATAQGGNKKLLELQVDLIEFVEDCINIKKINNAMVITNGYYMNNLKKINELNLQWYDIQEMVLEVMFSDKNYKKTKYRKSIN